MSGGTIGIRKKSSYWVGCIFYGMGFVSVVLLTILIMSHFFTSNSHISPSYTQKRPMIEHEYVYHYGDIKRLIEKDIKKRVGFKGPLIYSFDTVSEDYFIIIDADSDGSSVEWSFPKIPQIPQITVTYKTECCGKEK